jgi:long-subunit fatty acid transport protein
MKRISVLTLAFVLIIIYATTAWGAAAVGYGTRAAGMGGAFTAVADDGSAPYWNPAGIVQIKYVTFTPSFGAEGTYDIANDLIDTSSGLPKFTNNSCDIMVTGYLGITTRYVGLNAFVDVHGSVETVSNKAQYQGVGYAYGALTMAGRIGEQWAVGLNVKAVQAKTTISTISQDGSGYKSYADGDGMAYDIGMLYQLSEKTRLGFMGRNILGSVDWKDGKEETYAAGGTLNPATTTYNPTEDIPKSYTLGIACNPYESLTLAADVEMIDETGLNAVDQTRLHVGLEQTALWNIIAIRLGAFTNKGEDTGYSAGFGTKLGPLLVDAAYVQASDDGYYVTAGFKF